MNNINKKVTINYVQIENEGFYKISNNDELRPFFMSIVSDSNHWLFISSNGGLSAGRKNAENALFPYYTDDKINESSEVSGTKSIFWVTKNGASYIWEPFSYRFDWMYNRTRNLYKSVYGNKVIFEEENHDLELTFRYTWQSSNTFGFVKKSSLINNSTNNLQISVLDGIQNILPFGVSSELQNRTSNLVDAYKRCELEKNTGMGIFSLSAFIVDKAEPSEALKANIVWSVGFKQPTHLLSSLQLNNFRKKLPLREEDDIKAEKGAYFINTNLSLPSNSKKEWMIVANVNQSHSAIAKILKTIKTEKHLEQVLDKDVELGTKRLIRLNAAADGLQLTSDKFRDTRHFSNVLFNIMRGGILDHNYKIEKNDIIKYLQNANKNVFESSKLVIMALPDVFSLSKLRKVAFQSNDADFTRLCMEYMPLKFSRRHGDPSRPWNKFSINTRSEEDGKKILDYEGNWRDIFQNWEALAHSYPLFVESMIHKFLNASTFDGYNPYRVTKDGFDWEVLEADNPWSYIGYWGDHQIIYLLKLLEVCESHFPGKLESYFDKELFVYANIPYKIKSYEALVENSKDTIEFDDELDAKIRKTMDELGADGALLYNENEPIYTVSFIEKILASVLAKLSNFIPEGGIWMNTQRPEWNDANNALVGNGVSMVTLCYLRRFMQFFEKLLAHTNKERFKLSNELIIFYKRVRKTFEKHEHLLSKKMTNKERKLILDHLGRAGSDYRWHIYKRSFWGEKRTISLSGLKRFVKLSLKYLEHTIQANKRPDNLYHAYNLMTVESDKAVTLSYLNEMLEGQVAVLSSGYLSSGEILELLDALKQSKLFRPDQYSYLLYPNKEIPRFLEKNNIPAKAVAQSGLLKRLLKDGNTQIIDQDVNGIYHFNGNFKNAIDLQTVLQQLAQTQYAQLVKKESKLVLQIFEDVFNHKAFTGRSGTFFGYEGLGSIYWHMVSKLQLAVQECCLTAIENNESEEVIGRLLEHYYEINEGIGVHKPPTLYGAFSTDPYSHTPAGKGAQQPGMTGQVKEDILCRFGELGVFVKTGKLHFNPCLLRKSEFLKKTDVFKYVDVSSMEQYLILEKNTLCFTYCQVPVVYKISKKRTLYVFFRNNTHKSHKSMTLDLATSKEVFERTGNVTHIVVQVNETDIK